MAPLSYDLAGMILPHDTFGSHLDSQLRTVDEELEKRNFKVARNVLTSVWEDTIIDGYPVLAKYVNPSEEPYYLREKSATWMENHKPHSICAASMSIFDNTTHFSGFLFSVLMERKLIPPDTNLHYLSFDWTLKYHTRGCSHKQSNLLVKPDTDTQDFQANNISIHNYWHSEFLVSNENYEAIWVDKEVIPKNLSETYHQVQIQEELVADKVLIVDWEAWTQSEWTNEE
ncbi:10681_t:CDS:2 [Dentiscutata erythropus]|uniref:10681_t:CDS:1 n=1 Tax=Dentiscutata erythropus TaxID=1348616 RepID=A0A9N9D496_9GLOM|nr:10681_t:CDS:2 [Dentiscutata erythropus]